MSGEIPSLPGVSSKEQWESVKTKLNLLYDDWLSRNLMWGPFASFLTSASAIKTWFVERDLDAAERVIINNDNCYKWAVEVANLFNNYLASLPNRFCWATVIDFFRMHAYVVVNARIGDAEQPDIYEEIFDPWVSLRRFSKEVKERKD
jgi:hypothetical protein